MSKAQWVPVAGQDPEGIVAITSVVLASCSTLSIAIFHFMRTTENVAEFYKSGLLSIPIALLSPKNLPYLLLIPLLGWCYYRLMLSDKDLRASCFWVSIPFALNTVFALAMEHSDYREIFLPFRSIGTSVTFHILIITGFICIYYSILHILYYFFEKSSYTFNKKPDVVPKAKLVFIAAILIFCCWIPSFILCFPCTMPSDTLAQIKMFLGLRRLDVSHPILASIFSGSLFSLGRYIGGDNLGVFLPAFVQAILNAMIMGAVAVNAKKYTKSTIVYYLVIAFYGICPVWCRAAQTPLKDVLHTGCYLLFYMQYLDCLVKKQDTPMDAFLITVYAILVSFTRKATFYLAVLGLVVLIIKRYKKGWIKYGVSLAVVASLFFGLNNIVYPALGFIGEREEENYSLQFQQMAFYCRTYQNEITAEEKQIINSTLDFDKMVSDYTPLISDPVKSTFHARGKDHTEFWNVYRSMVYKHPLAFVKATIMNNFEYMNPWYQGNSGGVYHAVDNDNFYHVEFLMNVWAMTRYWKSWFNIPFLRLFVNPGLFSWILIALFGYSVSKKSLYSLLGLIPGLILLIGLFFSHVNGMMRYAYPLIAQTPLLIAYVYYATTMTITSSYSLSSGQKIPSVKALISPMHLSKRLQKNHIKLLYALQPYQRSGSKEELSGRKRSEVSQISSNTRKELLIYNRYGDVLLIDFLAQLCANGGNKDIQTFCKVHYATLSKYVNLWQGIPHTEELEAVLGWVKVDQLPKVYSLCMKRIQERGSYLSPKHVVKKFNSADVDGISKTQLLDLRGDLIVLGQQRTFAGNMTSADFCQLLSCMNFERGLLQIDAYDLAFQSLNELATRKVSFAVYVPNSQQGLQSHILNLFERSTTKDQLDALSKTGQFAVTSHHFSDFSTITSCWQADQRNSNLIMDRVLVEALESFSCDGVAVICYLKRDNATGVASKLYECFLFSSRTILASELIAMYQRGAAVLRQYDWSILCDSGQEPEGAWQGFSRLVSTELEECCSALLERDNTMHEPVELKRRKCSESIQYAIRLIKAANFDQMQ